MKKSIKVLILLMIAFVIIIILDIKCSIKEIIGIPCPGCGMTRAWISFFNGDIKGALFWHPLFWLAPIILFIIIYNIGSIENKRIRNFLIVAIGAFLLVYIIRICIYFPDIKPMDYNYDSIIYRLLKN